MKKLLLAVVMAAALVLPAEARANGRFPEANQLLFSPTDPSYVLLRVTFGLMVSRDRGATWHWICEQAIGFNGVEDPMYAVTPSRTMLGTTFQGLARTTQDGCQWAYVGGELEQQVFIDLTTRADDPKNILTFASSYDYQDDAGAIFFRSSLFETKDEGQTFTAIDAGLDATLLGYTVDFAPSDPNRIYLTATRDPGFRPRGFLLTSRDRGQTWTETSVDLLPQEISVFIAGVDPTNADRVYLRTAAGTDKPTRLLVSDDGGATVRSVFSAEGSLQGFALSKDGSKVYIGGPRVSVVTMPDAAPATRLMGLYTASAQDLAFTQVSTIDIHCLNMQDDGLWACSNETNGGFVLGVSQDEGKTFTPKMRFCDVKGPIACPAGTAVAEVCAAGWPSQRALFGCDGSDAGTDLVEPRRESCDCRTTAPGSSWAAALAGIAAVLAVLRRVRKRA